MIGKKRSIPSPLLSVLETLCAQRKKHSFLRQSAKAFENRSPADNRRKNKKSRFPQKKDLYGKRLFRINNQTRAKNV
ncbi:MAG: hypothetical protein IJZ24_07165 [Clostridia bacterium]|nr:hypothetical protein [Clostridia bacterium]